MEFDGAVLVCQPFGHWSLTSGWSGVHEIGSRCAPPREGSAVSPGGVGLICEMSSYGIGTWQTGP